MSYQHSRVAPVSSASSIASGVSGPALRLTCALAGGHDAPRAGHCLARFARAPVDIAADSGSTLEDSRQSRGVSAAGVSVTQAGLNIRSDGCWSIIQMPTGSKIQRITATAEYIVTRGNERASGNDAIYDFNRQRIITQGWRATVISVCAGGSDTLKVAGRLVIDFAKRTVDG